MEPLFVLVLLPVVIGFVSERVFADTTTAALVAAIVTALVLFASLQVLAPDAQWNSLAALLVSPLPIAFALATVVICCGRPHHRRDRHGDARERR
jgi:hypothetical protein